MQGPAAELGVCWERGHGRQCSRRPWGGGWSWRSGGGWRRERPQSPGSPGSPGGRGLGADSGAEGTSVSKQGRESKEANVRVARVGNLQCLPQREDGGQRLSGP